MRKALISVALGLALAGPGEAAATRQIYEPPILGVIFHSCYDGDTCTVSLPGVHALFGDHIQVRIAGIDTPEIRGKCGREKELARSARNLVNERLTQARIIDLEDLGRDKYFRVLARIISDGRDLSADLLAAGLARPYHGGRKPLWCS